VNFRGGDHHRGLDVYPQIGCEAFEISSRREVLTSFRASFTGGFLFAILIRSNNAILVWLLYRPPRERKAKLV